MNGPCEPDSADVDEPGVSRRDFVKSGMVAGVAAGMATAQAASPAQAQQAFNNPLSNRWWPSPWGAQDQRAACHRITPQKVLEAGRLIKTGKIYPLGRVLERGIRCSASAGARTSSFRGRRRAVRSGNTSSFITTSSSSVRSVRSARQGATGSLGNSVAIA